MEATFSQSAGRTWTAQDDDSSGAAGSDKRP